MSKTHHDPSEVISARVYGLILSSPRLRSQIIPQGLALSPYRVLDYDHTLTLCDPNGIEATYTRSQKIVFQQSGVSALLDHAWSEGVLVDYACSAGRTVQTLKDAGRRHFVVELPRNMMANETLEFQVERTEMEAFLGRTEWVEVTIDHPVEYVRQSILFPAGRPPMQAMFSGDGSARLLKSIELAGGQTLVHAVIPNPKPHTRYRIDWVW